MKSFMDSEMILAFLPGAAQGITSVVLGHPLDTAKTRMQAVGPGASRSFPSTMWNMARGEGVKSFYRGVTPPLVMSAAKRSLQFAIWDLFRSQKEEQTSNHNNNNNNNTNSNSNNSNSGKSMTTSSSYAVRFFSQMYVWIGASPFRSGAFAGAVGTLIGCPMHVIKIRTQFATHNETRNAWTCALDIFRTEGLRGYYRGYRYQLLKDTLFASFYLGFYDVCKRWLRGRSAPVWGDGVADILRGASSTQLAFLAGSISSMVTWALLYPFDTLKTVAQARGVGLFSGGGLASLRNSNSNTISSNSNISNIISSSGNHHYSNNSIMNSITSGMNSVRWMYRGLGASLVKAGPVCGAAMVVYEWTKAAADSRRRCVQQERYGV